MNENTKKFGALLATLALFASMLLVSIPVGANPGTDVYVKAIMVGSGTPIIGDNITVSADIQAADLNCTNVKVTFEAVNGTTIVGLGFTTVTANVSKLAAVPVAWYWNSTAIVPDASLVYDIKVTLTLTGDTNLTNDTKTLAAAIDWKAPKLNVTAIGGAADALIGDDYTLSVTVKNEGDAPFAGVKAFKVFDGATERATSEVNGTTTAIAIAGTKTIDVVFATTGFAVGAHTFITNLAGTDDHIATFAAKVTNVSVTDITFSPLSGIVKGTQTVTITATLENTGTADWVETALVFAVDNVAITTCTETVNITANGGTNTTTCTWTVPTATVQKTYKINVTGDLTTSKDLVALPTPHTVLGVSGISFNPSALAKLEEPAMTQDLTITVTVANTGDKNAVNAVVTIKADTTEIYTNNSVNITLGGRATVVFVYSIATAEADKLVDFNVTITLGTNTDYLVKNITVPGDNDVAAYEITELTVTPATSQERGVAATIKATVKNVGDALGTSITLKFKAGTADIKTETLVNLTVGGAGNTSTVTWNIPLTFALGDVNINVTIDGETVYKNVTYKIIEFKKPIITATFEKDKKGKVKSYSSTGADGSSKTLKINVVLANTGTATASNVKVIIKDSKGKELGNTTVASIAAGASSTATIAIKMKAGASTKLTADVTYGGVHADTYPATTTETASAKVVKTPGFEAVILVAAVAVAVVVLSRRKK